MSDARLKTLRRTARRGLERLGLMGPVYRAVERRLAQRTTTWAPSADGLATPSPYLVTLVASNPDLPGFLEHGRHIAGYLAVVLARHGRRFDTAQTMLDFGCGCGRIARHVAPQTTAAGGELIGLDINPKLVRWCAANLPGRYQVSRLQPPTPLDAGSVDILYAVSVFTHLPQSSMETWLAEFSRLLRPGGLALVSFADEGRVDPARRAALDREGFVLSTRALEGSNYMSSYVLSTRFAEMAARTLQVAEIIPSSRSGETLAWAVLRKPA